MNGDISSIDLLKKLEIDGFFNLFGFDSIFFKFNTLKPFMGQKILKRKKVFIL